MLYVKYNILFIIFWHKFRFILNKSLYLTKKDKIRQRKNVHYVEICKIIMSIYKLFFNCTYVHNCKIKIYLNFFTY